MPTRSADGFGQAVVCDPHTTAADTIARTLATIGFDVTTCRTAAACQAAVTATSPALVTLPILLPDLDGFALARWICAQRHLAQAASAVTPGTAPRAAAGAPPSPRARHMPLRVVMVSALQAAQRARAAGVDAFLLKPVDPPLLAKLAAHLVTRPADPRRERAAIRAATSGQDPDLAPLAEVIARTARALGALDQPDEILAAVLASARTYLGAASATLLRSAEGGLRLAAPAPNGQPQEEVRGATQGLEESGLVPAGGGAYPIVLGGSLEGVLVLADVVPERLSAHEGPIMPLLDVAGAALRDARLQENLRRQRREREAHSFARITGPPSTTATAESFGLVPLRAAAPGLFDGFTRRYGDLLDLALERRAYKGQHHLPDALRALAEQLGLVRAGPRDVIELHTIGLRGRTTQARSRKAQAYAEEAQIMVLELMGHLASFYRRHAGPLGSSALDPSGPLGQDGRAPPGTLAAPGDAAQHEAPGRPPGSMASPP